MKTEFSLMKIVKFIELVFVIIFYDYIFVIVFSLHITSLVRFWLRTILDYFGLFWQSTIFLFWSVTPYFLVQFYLFS